MQMLVSSAHPHIAGLQVALVDILVDYGARPSGVNDDGSPLMTAFRFHYPRAAEALVRRGARVDNVISAAALGRADLLADWVVDGATLAPDVHLAAGPVAAAQAGPANRSRVRADVGGELGQARRRRASVTEGRRSERQGRRRDGASLCGRVRPYGYCPTPARVRRVARDANSYGGTVLDGTLWYAYKFPVKGVDYPAVIRALIDAGARTDVYPEMQQWIDEYLKRG